MMRFMLACGALYVALGSPPVGAAQGTFDGLVVGKITTQDGKTYPFRYYQLGSRVRQEYDVGGGNAAATIYDGTTGDAITLIPQQKKYMVMNYREMGEAARQMAGAGGGGRQSKGAGDLSKMKVTPTGRREIVAGIPCEHYLFENAESRDHTQLDICGAAGLGFMGMSGPTASAMPSTAALMRASNPELAKLARQGFMPLKMTITGEHEKPVVWEVTQVDRHRPDVALFAPPPGFTKLDIPTMPGARH